MGGSINGGTPENGCLIRDDLIKMDPILGNKPRYGNLFCVTDRNEVLTRGYCLDWNLKPCKRPNMSKRKVSQFLQSLVAVTPLVLSIIRPSRGPKDALERNGCPYSVTDDQLWDFEVPDFQQTRFTMFHPVSIFSGMKWPALVFDMAMSV